MTGVVKVDRGPVLLGHLLRLSHGDYADYFDRLGGLGISQGSAGRLSAEQFFGRLFIHDRGSARSLCGPEHMPGLRREIEELERVRRYPIGVQGDFAKWQLPWFDAERLPHSMRNDCHIG